MIALKEVEIPFCKGNYRQLGRGFGSLAQIFGRTTFSFLLKYVVPAANCVGVDLLEFAAPYIAEVVSGMKNFKTTAKNMG